MAATNNLARTRLSRTDTTRDAYSGPFGRRFDVAQTVCAQPGLAGAVRSAAKLALYHGAGLAFPAQACPDRKDFYNARYRLWSIAMLAERMIERQHS
jgi:hypothetical protein